MNILAVIPARGGSKGIPRKNVKLLCGQPLISYVINTLHRSRYDMDIAVSSDDMEILSISSKYGAIPVVRTEELASDEVTLDPVIFHAVIEMEKMRKLKYDYVITIQPTSPLLTCQTLDNAIKVAAENGYDTVISAVNAPKLSWRVEDGKIIPNYKKRVNRQYMDKHYVETGAFVISCRDVVTETSRFGKSISVYDVPKDESVDIDHIEDWWLVEKILGRKKIIIRVDGYREIGLGHIYRGLQLIDSLTDSEVFFVLKSVSDIGIKKIKESFYPFQIIEHDDEICEIIDNENVDIVINDILNTTEEYMEMLKKHKVRIINFEDLGEGANLADAVINDLYEKENDNPNYYWGSDYYLIRNEFLMETPKEFSDTVREIIVLFGGTDPKNLTKSTVSVLKEIVVKHDDIHCTVILGMGYDRREDIESLVNGLENNFEIVQNVKMMTEYMKKADLAISSQGRTMLELASMAVPTVLLAEHERESRHEFGGLENGFLNMGLGSELEHNTLYQTLLWLIECKQIRKSMHDEMMKKDLRNGFRRVRKIIFGEE